ncbi:MAG TPA: D-alanyl-D-alanine carboxypeptidase family protein [Coriobacteriia bacterium]
MAKKAVPPVEAWHGRIGSRLVALVLVLSLALLAPVTALAATFGPPAVKVPSAVLMTMDGTVLWSRQPGVRRQTASTIKMLNALVLRDRGISLDTTVTVPKQAVMWNGGVGLVKGQRLTYRQLLGMMLIASANDAALTVGIRVAGSEKAYVALMNAKAASLGLINTHATDTNGLSKKERSTASDLTVLARHVMADPVLAAIVRTPSVVVPRPKKKPRTFKSTDLLLGHYAGIEGVKTGFTNPAGYCFVGAALRGPVELLGVVLGAKSNKGRFDEMRRLLDWGFAHTHVQTLVMSTSTAGVVAVEGVPGVTVTAHPASTVTRLMLDGAFDTTVTLPATVAAPVTRGQRLGTIQVGRGGVTLANVPLVSDSDVAAPSLLDSIVQTLTSWR